MAGLAVGGSILSAFLQVVFDKAASHAIQEAASFWGLEQDIKKLRMTLLRIKGLVTDAETRLELEGESYLDEWLASLSDVAYEADDLLDDLDYERLRRDVERNDDDDQVSEDSWNIRGIQEKLKTTSYVFNDYRDSVKIRGIQEKLDAILEDAVLYKLEKLSTQLMQHNDSKGKRVTSSIPDEEQMIGRDDVREDLIRRLLLKEQPGNIEYLPIVGMGGIGKTTLAQHVYNDERVKAHFELRMWVCVSDDFNKKMLTVKIIESAIAGSKERGSRDEPREYKNWDVLQDKLKDELSGSRFFLVLDDVWNEDKDEWESLKKPFRFGGIGSKVLITTRTPKIAGIMSSTEPTQVGGLLEEDFWSLFTKHAFGGSRSCRHTNQLERIGREIVKKLKGLPLAAKTVGSLLYSDMSITHWNDILRSEIWELGQKGHDIAPALILSYQHLPEHLKPCFAYFSLFPQDCIFEEMGMVNLWIVQGFVRPHGSKHIEDVGKGYFNELLDRSIIQHFSGGSDMCYFGDCDRYVMHDLIHSLAKMVSKNEYFTVKHSSNLNKIPVRVRHLSIFTDDAEVAPTLLKHMHNFSGLRSLLFFHREKKYATLPSYISPTIQDDIPYELLNVTKSLRVLDVSGYEIKVLPDSIGQLKHLRFLNLCYSSIKSLPESLCRLYHLQVLALKGCVLLHELPKGTGNLKSLRKLPVRGCRELRIPKGNGKLSSLEELVIYVSDESSCTVRELKDMNGLRKLRIKDLDKLKSTEDSTLAGLRNKRYLDRLELIWDVGRDAGNDEEVLEGLQPNSNIRELRIDGYRGVKSPNWLDGQSLPCIERISLLHCRNWDALPPLSEFRCLKSIMIHDMSALKQIGLNCSLPLTLESLHVKDCSELDVEEGVGLFRDLTCLDYLRIGNCPKLVSSLMSTDDWSLPPSLEYVDIGHVYMSLNMLCIVGWPNITKLSAEVLHHMTSLTELYLKDCEALESLEFEALVSLHWLKITNCPKLHSLPDLPTSLQGLSINKCPVLQQRCRKDEGTYWPKISCIPFVYLEGKLIPSDA